MQQKFRSYLSMTWDTFSCLQKKGRIHTAFDIFMKLWRPTEIKQYFAPVTMNIAGNSVANHPDPQYFLVLSVGLGITLITAVFLIFMSWRETRLKRQVSI